MVVEIIENNGTWLKNLLKLAGKSCNRNESNWWEMVVEIIKTGGKWLLLK